MPQWRGNRQTIVWFRDLHSRGILDMDPSYQRRSVWTQRYREDFVETVLLGYPSPSIFLHEEITLDGAQSFAVVDGKQRLTAVLDFVADRFATRDDRDTKLASALRGRYFRDLDDGSKRQFWNYELSVEYLPTTDEVMINEVFDRINRNVVKLSRQELRHARHDGLFATAVDELTEQMERTLPAGFPRIVETSRRQMKDVEFTAQLILLVERGPSASSQDVIDEVYATRDEEWDEADETRTRFAEVISVLKAMTAESPADIATTRLRNQGDFYSLFGAVRSLMDEGTLPDTSVAAGRLAAFISAVGTDDGEGPADGTTVGDAAKYFDAARSAANDPGQRRTRVDVLTRVILGEA